MKKENRIHDIFITYSKLPLETNPEKLFEIFEIAQKHIFIDTEILQTADGVIKCFGHMASKSNFENIKECQQKREINWNIKHDQKEDNRLYELAYKNTYPPKYFYGFYEGEFEVPPEDLDESKYCRINLSKLHKVIPRNIKLPKLYVETQFSFNKLLEEIISEKQFSKIKFPNLKDGFSNIAIDSYSLIQSKIKVVRDEKSGAESLEKQTIWGTNAEDLLRNGECEFNDLALNLVGYSLIEFLLSPYRKKLKKCNECNKFFIADKDINTQRFCCKKHRLAWHNRMRIESGEHAKYKRERKKAGRRQQVIMGKR
jgi:hypothetical protein